MAEPRRRRLIGVLVEIASVVGEDATWALVDRFGGQEIWVPSPERIEPGHPIAQALGIDTARRFCRRFEGPRLLIPIGMPHGLRRAVDAQRVRELVAEGRPAASVARDAGCHLRTVWRHRRRLRAS
jgi:hypothetical protein